MHKISGANGSLWIQSDMIYTPPDIKGPQETSLWLQERHDYSLDLIGHVEK